MSESSVSPPATPPPTGPWTRHSLLGSLYLCIFILINTWLSFKSKLKSLLFFGKKKILYWVLTKVLIPQLAFFVYHSFIPWGLITRRACSEHVDGPVLKEPRGPADRHTQLSRTPFREWGDRGVHGVF